MYGRQICRFASTSGDVPEAHLGVVEVPLARAPVRGGQAVPPVGGWVEAERLRDRQERGDAALLPAIRGIRQRRLAVLPAPIDGLDRAREVPRLGPLVTGVAAGAGVALVHHPVHEGRAPREGWVECDEVRPLFDRVWRPPSRADVVLVVGSDHGVVGAEVRPARPRAFPARDLERPPPPILPIGAPPVRGAGTRVLRRQKQVIRVCV